MKKFYANLIDTTNKKAEVNVCGVKVSYSEAILNFVFGLSNVKDTYQNLLENSYDQDCMESLCNPETKWVEASGEKTVRRMHLRPECKVWYQI